MSNTIIKGTSYELFIRDYLNNIIDNQQAWLWNKTPEKVLRDCNIIGEWNKHRLKRKEYKIIINKIENGEEIDEEENSMIDLGVDIILKKDNEYIFVQCKNYNDNNVITTEKLAGFYSMIIHYEKRGILYYTSKLSKNIIIKKECNSIEYIKKSIDNEELYNEKATSIYNNNNLKVKESKESIDLKTINKTNLIKNAYDYQIEAYNKISESFETKNRAILNLPCGLGKTLISMMIGLNYNQIVIISPFINKKTNIESPSNGNLHSEIFKKFK
jgi:predicted helicase